MFVGYMRVPKADRSQTTDAQRGSLVEARVDDERLHQGRASGQRADRLGLAERPESLRAGTCSWSESSTGSAGTCTSWSKELGISRQTLYRHVAPNGKLRPDDAQVLART